MKFKKAIARLIKFNDLLWGRRKRRPRARILTDAEAVAADWDAVGRDLNAAFRQSGGNQ